MQSLVMQTTIALQIAEMKRFSSKLTPNLSKINVRRKGMEKRRPEAAKKAQKRHIEMCEIEQCR